MPISTSDTHVYSLEQYLHPQDLSSDYRWKIEDSSHAYISISFKAEEEAKAWLTDHHLITDYYHPDTHEYLKVSHGWVRAVK